MDRDSAAVIDLITSNWKTAAVCVAAQLHLAEWLRDGPRTATELAELTHTDSSALKRLLDSLVTLELLEGADPYNLTPAGKLLDPASPNSLHAWALWWGEYNWDAWGNLLYSVQTGASARSMLSGKPSFDTLLGDPEAAAVFNRSMAELTQLEIRAILSAFDFSRFGSLVDVGGGLGQLLAAILAVNAGAQGRVADMPHAEEGALSTFRQGGLLDRATFEATDFFETVPSGADAYILKNVLHDWKDEDCHRILSVIRRTAPTATLLVIERVRPEALQVTREHQDAARADLHMLVGHGARERTEAEFRQLLHESGYVPERFVPCDALTVIEARASAP